MFCSEQLAESRARFLAQMAFKLRLFEQSFLDRFHEMTQNPEQTEAFRQFLYRNV